MSGSRPVAGQHVPGEYVRLDDGTLAYAARPESATAGLVLLASMPGLVLFERWTRELATEQGWAVIAPEIISDQPGLSVDERSALVPGLDDADVLQRLRAAAAYTGCARVHLIGFCVGGMYALKATDAGLFDRIVAFYGMVRVPDFYAGPGQSEPLEHLAGSGSEVLGLYGGQDPFVPAAHVAALREADVEVVEYPQCGHAFAHDPANPSYDAGASRDAWTRAIAFLRRSGVDGARYTLGHP